MSYIIFGFSQKYILCKSLIQESLTQNKLGSITQDNNDLLLARIHEGKTVLTLCICIPKTGHIFQVTRIWKWKLFRTKHEGIQLYFQSKILLSLLSAVTNHPSFINFSYQKSINQRIRSYVGTCPRDYNSRKYIKLQDRQSFYCIPKCYILQGKRDLENRWRYLLSNT